MAMKAESRFQARIRPKLAALPNTWLVKVQQVAIRGTPDFLICVAGYFVALELKASEKKKPDPLQQHELRKIHKAYGIALTVCPENFVEIYALLHRLATATTQGDTYAARSDLRHLQESELQPSAAKTRSAPVQKPKDGLQRDADPQALRAGSATRAGAVRKTRAALRKKRPLRRDPAA